MLQINLKGKRKVGKANKGINVEKAIISLKKLKIRIKKKRGKKKKKNTPKNCKSPTWRQRFITTIKNVTEKKRRENSKP